MIIKTYRELNKILFYILLFCSTSFFMEKIILNIPINRKMLEIIYPIIERILLLSLSFTKLITGNMKRMKTPKIPLNI